MPAHWLKVCPGRLLSVFTEQMPVEKTGRALSGKP